MRPDGVSPLGLGNMASLGEVLGRVLDRLEAGRIDAADELLALARSAAPEQPDVLHLSGLVAARAGRIREGLDYLERARAARPDAADIRSNLRAAAEAAWAAAERSGDADLAARAARAVLAVDPGDLTFLFRSAAALTDLGRAAEAVEVYRELVRAAPETGAVWNNLALAQIGLGRRGEAEFAFRRRLVLDPGEGASWVDFAPLAADLAGHVARLSRALRLGCGSAIDWHGLGERFPGLALVATLAAVCLDPRDAGVWNNLGSRLSRRGDRLGSLRAHQRAAAIEPENVKYRFNRGIARLASGDLSGWGEYALGPDAIDARPPERFPELPRWDGGPLDGPLLVTREQGVGDEVFFAQILPDLLDRVPAVWWECDGRLLPLFRRSFPGVNFLSPPIRAGGAVARFPSADLPGLFRPDFAAFARTRSPYLRVDPDAVARARRRNDPGDGLPLIGVSWFSKNAESGADRSVALTDLAAAITASAPARMVNLQYGDVVEDVARARAAGFDVVVDSAVDTWADIDGLAALIAATDLVVSIDNSTVHLAGALGAPVWILLPPGADWRWFVDPERSPWYPSARLFRRPVGADWRGTLSRLDGAPAAARRG